MTLLEWRTLYPTVHVQSFGAGGSLQVFNSNFSFDAQWELYHLADWVVSSAVSGPSVVLVPRPMSDTTNHEEN